MSLLDDIPEGAIVGLDTAPIIYYIERHPSYSPIVDPFFDVRIKSALNLALTSAVSLVESLIMPLRMGRQDLVAGYRTFLVASRDLELVALSTLVSEQAAELRARYNLRLADACQMAAAVVEGATHFLTNDRQLRRVTELNVLILDDYLPPPAAVAGPVP